VGEAGEVGSFSAFGENINCAWRFSSTTLSVKILSRFYLTKSGKLAFFILNILTFFKTSFFTEINPWSIIRDFALNSGLNLTTS
jgi:hypothetical protein